MARIKDSSVEAVKAATDIVTLVEGYTRLRKSGSRYTGLCPFHQEKTPSFGVSPERGTFKCFGCGEGGDAIAFVEKKENVDFVGAIEWLADRFGVRLEYEETSPEQDRLRKRRERLFQLLDRAATFYERYLWESEAGVFARGYLAERGLREEICREFRLGLAPGGAALTRGAAEQGFTRGRACRSGPHEPSRERLLLTASARSPGRRARAGARIPGAAAVRGRPVARQVRQLARGGPVPEGRPALRARPGEGGDREAEPRARRRREPRCDRAAPGRLRTGRRGDGHRAHRAAAGRDQESHPESLALLRRRRRRTGGDPARDGAGDRAGLRDQSGLAAARHRPRRRRERLRGTAADGRGLPAVPGTRGGASGRFRIASARSSVSARSLPRFPIRPSGRTRFDSPPIGSAFPPSCRQGSLPPRGPVPGRCTHKALEAGVRLERNALAGVLVHPQLVPMLAGVPPEQFDVELHRRVRDHLVAEGPTDVELVGALAELDARAAQEAIDEIGAKQALLRLSERGTRAGARGRTGRLAPHDRAPAAARADPRGDQRARLTGTVRAKPGPCPKRRAV